MQHGVVNGVSLRLILDHPHLRNLKTLCGYKEVDLRTGCVSMTPGIVGNLNFAIKEVNFWL